MEEYPEDPEREERIGNEVTVDAYHETEVAMGWYYYLQDKMQFPFKARCIAVKKKSRLKEGDVVTVTGMAGEDECEHDMWVDVKFKKDTFVVPLAQLRPVDEDDEETLEAVEDWHYWLARGYQF
jgi:hypothetical protein